MPITGNRAPIVTITTKREQPIMLVYDPAPKNSSTCFNSVVFL